MTHRILYFLQNASKGEDRSFLKDNISYAFQQKRIDFQEAKTQFFNPKRKTKLGRMNFKKKGVARDSFRIPAQVLKNPFDFEEGTVKLTKLGKVKNYF
jgi:transposase